MWFIKPFKKIQYNSPVILSFTLVSFFVLILNSITQGSSNYLLFTVYRGSFLDPLLYFRLFGHVLGHSNFDHFFNNFLSVLLVGPILEEKYGSKKILIMMLFTALITGAVHMIISSYSMLLGASGIVFMFILLSSFVSLQKGKIPLTLILCIMVYMGREIFDGLFVDNQVSNITHIFGGACGAFFGFWLNRDKLRRD